MMHNSTTKWRPLLKLQVSIVLCLDVLAFQFQRLNRKIDKTKWLAVVSCLLIAATTVAATCSIGKNISSSDMQQR